MGLAIPIEDAQALLNMLKTGRQPQRPWLGISIQHVDAQLADSFQLTEAGGALVTRVIGGGPADKAGLRHGDIIISFAGRPVEDPLGLIEVVKGSRVGRAVKIRIVREGRRRNLRITPTTSPP
jgi:serine protease Do